MSCSMTTTVNEVKPVRLEPVAPRSQVKHSTTEPLHSHLLFMFHVCLFIMSNHEMV